MTTIINVSTTTIPKFIFDSKIYVMDIIDRICERFYQSPIDNDDFNLSMKSRHPYLKIANMKLWKGFDINKFIIIVKSANYGDPCLLVVKDDNNDNISIDFGHICNGKVSFNKNYQYSEKDTFGQDNILQIFSIDNHRNDCLKWTLLVMNLFNYCNDFFDKKEIALGGKNKKKKFLASYTFNFKKFESEFIGVNSYDSIIVKNYQHFFDPSHKIKNIFPFNRVIARISPDSLDNIDLIISFDRINDSKIILKLYEMHRINLYGQKENNWGVSRQCEVEYNPIKDSFEISNLSIDYESISDEEKQSIANDLFDAIDYLFDIFKYIIFNTKKVEGGKIYFNESSVCTTTTNKKRSDKYRNNIDMCSTVYEIDGQKVKQVDESIISENHRQVKPCEYAFTVRGHHRHLKDGRLIWVKSYIKNKDKEFKPKNYIDMKKE